ncbi:HAMP domain-containing protein (plasmid) [Haloarcula sp. NS06]|uniref:HAMP domain-containing protein n=1 Tax=Haloarcula sp. NS06 TaxID=3409688 RepID=UPI003DA70DE7
MGVVGVLGRDVTGALSRLTDRAEQIEDGQYDVEFDTDRPDEFGDLNRTIASTRMPSSSASRRSAKHRLSLKHRMRVSKSGPRW